MLHTIVKRVENWQRVGGARNRIGISRFVFDRNCWDLFEMNIGFSALSM